MIGIVDVSDTNFSGFNNKVQAEILAERVETELIKTINKIERPTVHVKRIAIAGSKSFK